MSHVFISYTRDEMSVARRFAQAFEAAGLKVWWDQTLRSGDAYDEVTEAALREAKAVVVLWSRKSVVSRWVRSEATLAQRQGTLLPVMIEACERPVMFELVQTADLSDWAGHVDHPAFQDLLAEVRCLVTGACEHMTPVELATGAALRLPSKPSIAVLPFTDLSGSDADHFADGMSEELAIVLSRFSSLFVIAGQSSLTYRGTTKPAQTIARELGVRYLLEGSVRRAGGRVRIAAKLSDALAGEQIWAERFDDRLDDIFDLQDKVATAVAGAIDSTITDAEMRRALTRPTTSPTAYELTLRANALLCRHGRESLLEALRLSEQAVALDPDFAWAIAIKGYCHAAEVLERWSLDPKADRKTAIALAQEAVRKGTNDQMALAVTAGLLLNLRHDRETATRLIARALELNPGKAFVLFWAGWIEFWNDRLEESLGHFEHSMRLDPRSAYRPFQLSGMGTALLALGRLDEALVVLRESLRLVRHSSAWLPLIVALVLSGRLEEARAELAEIGLRFPFAELARNMIGASLTRLVTEAATILDDNSQVAA